MRIFGLFILIIALLAFLYFAISDSPLPNQPGEDCSNIEVYKCSKINGEINCPKVLDSTP
jgi:hypothetical protein